MPRHRAALPTLTLIAGLAIGAGVATVALRHRAAACPATTAATPSTTAPPTAGAPLATAAGGSAAPTPGGPPAGTPAGGATPTPAAAAPCADPRAAEEAMMRERGVTTDDGWWDGMPLDPAWDAPQADRVRAVLLDQFAVKLGADAIACRTRCCRLRIPEEAFDRVADELGSAVGLAFGAAGGSATQRGTDGVVTHTACWDRHDDGAYPDRIAERDALLARTAGAVATCSRGVAPPVTLLIGLELDPAGTVAKVDSNAAELGTPAARCAEQAIVEAADFAPAPRGQYVVVRVTLGR